VHVVKKIAQSPDGFNFVSSASRLLESAA
jgi:hypothetical protein